MVAYSCIDIHKATWVAPNQRTFNQIDHMAISKKWRRSLLDVRGYRGVDVASDHYLVVAQIKLKLAANKTHNQRVTLKKFNLETLNHGEIRKKFEEELKESIEQEKMQELDPTEHWTKIKQIMSSKSENVLGLRQRTNAKD